MSNISNALISISTLLACYVGIYAGWNYYFSNKFKIDSHRDSAKIFLRYHIFDATYKFLISTIIDFSEEWVSRGRFFIFTTFAIFYTTTIIFVKWTVYGDGFFIYYEILENIEYTIVKSIITLSSLLFIGILFSYSITSNWRIGSNPQNHVMISFASGIIGIITTGNLQLGAVTAVAVLGSVPFALFSISMFLISYICVFAGLTYLSDFFYLLFFCSAASCTIFAINRVARIMLYYSEIKTRRSEDRWTVTFLMLIFNLAIFSLFFDDISDVQKLITALLTSLFSTIIVVLFQDELGASRHAKSDRSLSHNFRSLFFYLSPFIVAIFSIQILNSEQSNPIHSSTIQENSNNKAIGLVLMVLIFPMVNAIYDYLSYRVSIFYVKKILEIDVDRQYFKLIAFKHICFDIVVALVLMLIVGFSLIASIFFFEYAATSSDINSDRLVEYFNRLQAGSNPADLMWITAMIFTTLIPIAFHLTAATMALIRNLVSRKKRKYYYDILDKKYHKDDNLSEVVHGFALHFTNATSFLIITLVVLYYSIKWFIQTTGPLYFPIAIQISRWLENAVGWI